MQLAHTTKEQLRMAKAALGYSNPELSKLTGLHRNTLSKVESGKGATSTITLLRIFYESKGIIFLSTGDIVDGYGICLRKE